MMRELQSAIRSAGHTAEGPDNILYIIIRQLLDVSMATLLALYNITRDYPKQWKEVIIIQFLKAGTDVLKAENYR